IELSVAGQDVVSFELQKISAFDIESKTVVFAQNAREQSFLNEHALSDILSTLKTRGQQYPAVGRLMENGTVEILDGSRRRMSCILAKQDFLVYVAKDINTEHAKFLSDVANAHKPLSLFEKGKEMQIKLDTGEAADQKALAQMFQCSEALVSGALKAASLPLELLQAYPSVAELGRPTIVKLHKQFFTLSESMQQELVNRCKEQTVSTWTALDGHGVTRMTKHISEQIESWIAELSPQRIERAGPVKQELIKGRVSYSRKGANLTLNLKKLDDRKMARLFEFLEKELI
ncbi:ParB/RepB/Spo0J family partition protein, partial [Vibrio sp.]|nr:ParB/RepB/Spo0J family partition protein [Vibrio sp.]